MPADKTLIDINGLTRYHENIIETINSKANENHSHDQYMTEEMVQQMIADAIITTLNTAI